MAWFPSSYSSQAIPWVDDDRAFVQSYANLFRDVLLFMYVYTEVLGGSLWKIRLLLVLGLRSVSLSHMSVHGGNNVTHGPVLFYHVTIFGVHFVQVY